MGRDRKPRKKLSTVLRQLQELGKHGELERRARVSCVSVSIRTARESGAWQGVRQWGLLSHEAGCGPGFPVWPQSRRSQCVRTVRIVLSFRTAESGRRFLSLIAESAIPLISLISSFLLFLALDRLLGMDRKHLNLAAVEAATSNTIFIGIPVNNALFGEQAITHLLLYFLGNTLFFWTIGNFAIAKEGTKADHRLTKREILQRIFSAPLLGTLTGIALLLLNVPVPHFVTETCTMLGGLGSPLPASSLASSCSA